VDKKSKPKEGHEKQEKINFEKAMSKLEEIALNLEEGNLSLDESIRQFEKGMQLAKFCREKLDEAERKIEILQKGDDGKITKKQVDINKETGEILNDDDLQGSLL
jgi:exodeoxyribonuclease VII small subunit